MNDFTAGVHSLEVERLGAEMQSAWLAFARTGDPSKGDTVILAENDSNDSKLLRCTS
jgi:hypothetical protein